MGVRKRNLNPFGGRVKICIERTDSSIINDLQYVFGIHNEQPHVATSTSTTCYADNNDISNNKSSMTCVAGSNCDPENTLVFHELMWRYSLNKLNNGIFYNNVLPFHRNGLLHSKTSYTKQEQQVDQQSKINSAQKYILEEEDKNDKETGLLAAEDWQTPIEFNGTHFYGVEKKAERNNKFDNKQHICHRIWESEIFTNVNTLRHEEACKWYTISLLIPIPQNALHYFDDKETSAQANIIKNYIVSEKVVMQNVRQKMKLLQLKTKTK